MGRLDGKVAIVAGGTSGIGERTAERFVEEGARVVIAGRRAEEGERLAKHLGAPADFIRTDVTHEADIKAMLARAVDHFGRLDCLFNNAGGGTGASGSIESVTLEDYERTMAVLLRAVFLGIKHAAPIMRRQGGGSIINTGSIAGIRAGFSSSMIYSAAKAGMAQLSRCAAMELGEQGIRVKRHQPGRHRHGDLRQGPGSADPSGRAHRGEGEGGVCPDPADSTRRPPRRYRARRRVPGE